ncbi:MAG: phosphatase PAP2 family protein [Candidatus Nanopelagicales bacterium]
MPSGSTAPYGGTVPNGSTVPGSAAPSGRTVSPGLAAEGRTPLPPWWVEFLGLALGYVLYQGVQILVTGSKASAVARARDVWAVERALHLDPEIWLNHIVAGSHVLVVVTGLYYGILHFAVTPAVLIWLRVCRHGSYARLRNVLVVTSVAALVVFWLLPLAPPRLSVPDVIDTLKAGNILSAARPYGPARLADQFAAMPSLHVAWAVWVALALVVALPGVRMRYLAWLYPLCTVLVVLGTGNHFLADVVAGALLVWATWVITGRFPGSELPQLPDDVPELQDELSPALHGAGEP